MERPQDVKQGDQFVAVAGELKDQILTLERDDGTMNPFFKDNDGGNYCYSWHDLEPRTIERLLEGDIVVDEDGDEYEVAGVAGKIVHIFHDKNKVSYYVRSVQSLINDGWTLKGQSEEVRELSMDEIAKKFGLSADKIRVKKE